METAEKKYEVANGVKFERDWDNNGAIYMVKPKTIKRYLEIKKGEWLPKNMFFAFDKDQLLEGINKAKENGFDPAKDGKFKNRGAGIIATDKAVEEWNEYTKNKDKLIAKECDMQEVYFYEWENYECCIAYEGDEQPYAIIKRIYGEEKAKTLVRFNAY